MNPVNVLMCLACAFAIAAGQVLMKMASVSWNETNMLFSMKTMSWIVLAFAVYGGSSLIWVHILRQVPLSQAYPIVSITFILVPIASAVFFSEKFDWLNVISSLMIITGISLSTIGRHSSS